MTSSVSFQRLTTSKTTKFVKSFLVFTSLFTIHLGGPALQETVDAIQAGIFGMVVKRLQEDVQKVGPTSIFVLIRQGQEVLISRRRF